MKFGQLLEYNVKKHFFFKNHAENVAGKVVPDLFCDLKMFYIWSKQVVSKLVLIYFDRPPVGHTIRTET